MRRKNKSRPGAVLYKKFVAVCVTLTGPHKARANRTERAEDSQREASKKDAFRSRHGILTCNMCV